MNYFISAIGTDSGKSLISAILVEALRADYWKPIQAGEPGDTEMVKGLVSNEFSCFHEETHRLKVAASPHAAAKFEHKALSTTDFVLPETDNNLIIEGAGGLMVPLNDHEFVVDIAIALSAPIVLVCDLYLGSINHSLLSIDFLKRNHIPVKGIVFNGESNPESESVIEKNCDWPVLLRLPKLGLINKNVVNYWAEELLLNWND